MKYVLVLGLLITHSLGAMDSKHVWDDADGYKDGNWVQVQAGLELLQEAGDDFLLNKVVCDVGCGTGETTTKMAGMASVAIGIDASDVMINRAMQAFQAIGNVRFIHLAAEGIGLVNLFDSLTSFFCLHWIEDKQTVFTNFYRALVPGGKMLCTIMIQEPGAIEAHGEILRKLTLQYPELQNKTMQELTGRYGITTSDLNKMLDVCGFQSIMIEPKIMRPTFADRDAFARWQWPIFKGFPFVKVIPEGEVKAWFDVFIEGLWTKLKKNDYGHAVFPFRTTLISAQKPMD